MIKAHFIFCFLFSSSITFCQTPFEGKVIYKLTTEDENSAATVEVLYGKQKIKGMIKKSSTDFSKNQVILIDLLKGIVYSINDSTKSFGITTLKDNSKDFFLSLHKKTGTKEVVLGQPCTVFSFLDTAKSEFMGNMDCLFWYADSLYFPVNKEFHLTEDIAMFTNGKTIGMGMKMRMGDNESTTIFNLQAVEIKAMPLADSLFNLPPNYFIRLDESDEKIELKMSGLKMEALPSPPPPPPPPPTNPAPVKNKKKGKS